MIATVIISSAVAIGVWVLLFFIWIRPSIHRKMDTYEKSLPKSMDEDETLLFMELDEIIQEVESGAD